MGTEAQHFINLLSPYIHAYGYWVAFFGMMLENAGIPVPAETALIICSFFAGQGILNIRLIIPIAILGDAIGDNIGFFIGRLGGRPLVEKYGHYVRLDKDKLDAMEALFKEKGGRTVFTAHFFATTRIAAALTAGISHMHYPSFVAFNFAAAVTFISFVAGITFFFGKNLDATLRFFHMFRLVGLTVAVLLVTSYLYRFYQQKKHLYRKLGLKIITTATAASILFGLTVYAISGALIILPHTSRGAGLVHGSIQEVAFDVEQGFVSDIDNDSLLITARGQLRLKFHESKKAVLIKVIVRNVKARETLVQSSAIVQQPLVLDDLTLNFWVSLNPAGKTAVILKPKVATDRFDFAVTGDTCHAGPIFRWLLESVNDKKPAFLIHAGDFVTRGRKRRYREFLDRIGALRVPLYTTIGAHEITGHGEPICLRLFGPGNYSFICQNSKFIILNTSRLSITESDLEWLSMELKKSSSVQNIFLITYAAPLESERFTDLMSRFKVKTVYSVKVLGIYRPFIKGTRYDILEQKPQEPYFYKIVHVEGRKISEEDVKIIPQRLTILDRMGLIFEKMKRMISK